MYFGQKCYECNQYCYPRASSEILYYKEFKKLYRKAKSQWNRGLSYVDPEFIVRRFGYYKCGCENPDGYCQKQYCSANPFNNNCNGCDKCQPNRWVSAWTWTIKYLEEVSSAIFF